MMYLPNNRKKLVKKKSVQSSSVSVCKGWTDATSSFTKYTGAKKEPPSPVFNSSTKISFQSVVSPTSTKKTTSTSGSSRGSPPISTSATPRNRLTANQSTATTNTTLNCLKLKLVLDTSNISNSTDCRNSSSQQTKKRRSSSSIVSSKRRRIGKLDFTVASENSETVVINESSDEDGCCVSQPVSVSLSVSDCLTPRTSQPSIDDISPAPSLCLLEQPESEQVISSEEEVSEVESTKRRPCITGGLVERLRNALASRRSSLALWRHRQRCPDSSVCEVSFGAGDDSHLSLYVLRKSSDYHHVRVRCRLDLESAQILKEQVPENVKSYLTVVKHVYCLFPRHLQIVRRSELRVGALLAIHQPYNVLLLGGKLAITNLTRVEIQQVAYVAANDDDDGGAVSSEFEDDKVEPLAANKPTEESAAAASSASNFRSDMLILLRLFRHWHAGGVICRAFAALNCGRFALLDISPRQFRTLREGCVFSVSVRCQRQPPEDIGQAFTDGILEDYAHQLRSAFLRQCSMRWNSFFTVGTPVAGRESSSVKLCRLEAAPGANWVTVSSSFVSTDVLPVYTVNLSDDCRCTFTGRFVAKSCPVRRTVKLYLVGAAAQPTVQSLTLLAECFVDSDLRPGCLLRVVGGVVHRGLLVADRYTRVELVEEAEDGRRLLPTPRPLPPEELPLVQPGEMRQLVGSVTYVDVESASSWPECCACGSDQLARVDAGLRCERCSSASGTKEAYFMAVRVRLGSSLSDSVMVQLHSGTVQRLLHKSCSTAHSVSDVMGQHVELKVLVKKKQMETNEYLFLEYLI